MFLSELFSACLVHGYTPLCVLKGIINPLIKNQYDDICNSSNYRPIMMSSVLLKLFEYCILNIIKKDIKINDRQHGYREKYSVGTACLTLKETIYEYNLHDSNVYASFIDISKAFDSVDHGILINKLLKQNIPKIYINLIKFWYSNQFVNVRFGYKLSNEWKICNGVRQGGILSGLLFNLYIDSVLEKIVDSNMGCKIGIFMSNVIAYADDIVLLAPSAFCLQKLINILYFELINIKLKVNLSKTKCMLFSASKIKTYFNTTCLRIDDQQIEYVISIRYLGMLIQNDMRNIDVIKNLRLIYLVRNGLVRLSCSSIIN